MQAETVVSIVAATLTTIAFVPQALHIIRHKQTAGVSLATYVVFSIGVFFWLVFGILIDNWAIVLADGIALALSLLIVGLKLRYP